MKNTPVELSGDFLCHAEPVEASQPYHIAEMVFDNYVAHSLRSG